MDSLTALTEMRRGEIALVAGIDDADPALATDLSEAGFLIGETVEILERGAFGGTPLAVRLGRAIVALRLREAKAVKVSRSPSKSAPKEAPAA